MIIKLMCTSFFFHPIPLDIQHVYVQYIYIDGGVAAAVFAAAAAVVVYIIHIDSYIYMHIIHICTLFYMCICMVHMLYTEQIHTACDTYILCHNTIYIPMVCVSFSILFYTHIA